MARKTKKKNDVLEDLAKSSEMNPKSLEESKKIKSQVLEEIVRTTDSINIIAESANSVDEEENAKMLMLSRDAISRNYDLARRKITATYRDVLETGNFISTPFLSVEVTLAKYEKEWAIKRVERVIEIFSKSIVDTLSTGVGIAISNDLVLEAVVYINKILPASKVTPSFLELVNTTTWEELTTSLIKKGKLTQADAEIIETFVEALDKNVKQGYYVKISDIILSRVRPQDVATIVLLSYEKLEEMNEKYKIARSEKLKTRVTKSNTINSFIKSQKELQQKIQNAKDSASKTETTLKEPFTPNDDKDDDTKYESLTEEKEEKVSTKAKAVSDSKMKAKVDEANNQADKQSKKDNDKSKEIKDKVKQEK